MFGIPTAPQNRLDQQFQFMNALSQRLSKEMTSTFRGGIPSPVSPFYALAAHANLFGPYQMGPVGFGLGTAPPQLGSLLSGPIATSVSLLFGGRINRLLQEGGFEPGPIFGRYNPFDMMRNQAVNAGTMEAMQRSQRGDITGISRFLTNMAVIAKGPGSVDQAERARLEGFARSGAEHFQAMASPFIAMAAMNPALRKIFDAGTLGMFSRAFGGQISAATIGGAAPGLVGGALGLPPDQVSKLVSGIQQNFFPGGAQDILKTRGFQKTEIADLFSLLARQGAIGTGEIAPAGLDVHKVNRQLQSYTKALELVSQVMGSGKSMDQLLQGLNQITGGAVGQISPAQLEGRVNQFQELARSTGVSAGMLMQLTNQGAIFAGQVGVNPAAAGFDSAVGAVTVEAISRDRRRIAGGGIEYGRPTQLARIGALQQRIIGGRASTVGRTVAGIRAFARSLSPKGDLAEGMARLPADVRQAIEDYESNDIRRKARSLDVLRDPSAISSALADVVPGLTPANINRFMSNPAVFGEEQAREGMPGTVRILQAQAAEKLSDAADQVDIKETIGALGISLGRGERPRDLVFSLGEAFFKAPTTALGITAIGDILKRRGTRKLGNIPTIARVISGEIRTAVGVRREATIRQALGTMTPAGLKALRDLHDRETLRSIYGETAAGKMVPGDTFSSFIGNIYSYLQSANPNDVDMAEVLSRMAGGVPKSFADKEVIRRIAEERGIDLKDSEGEDRNIGGVLLETFRGIRQDMLSDDTHVRTRAEQQFRTLMQGGGAAMAKIYTAAELMQIRKMLGKGTDPEVIKQELETLREIQGRISGDTAPKIINREGGLKRVRRVSKSLNDLADKLDTFKTAHEAGKSLTAAYRRVGESIFEDLPSGKLRAEFEGYISAEDAESLASRISKGASVGKSFEEEEEDQSLTKRAVKDEKDKLRALSKSLRDDVFDKKPKKAAPFIPEQNRHYTSFTKEELDTEFKGLLAHPRDYRPNIDALLSGYREQRQEEADKAGVTYEGFWGDIAKAFKSGKSDKEVRAALQKIYGKISDRNKSLDELKKKSSGGKDSKDADRRDKKDADRPEPVARPTQVPVSKNDTDEDRNKKLEHLRDKTEIALARLLRDPIKNRFKVVSLLRAYEKKSDRRADDYWSSKYLRDPDEEDIGLEVATYTHEIKESFEKLRKARAVFREHSKSIKGSRKFTEQADEVFDAINKRDKAIARLGALQTPPGAPSPPRSVRGDSSADPSKAGTSNERRAKEVARGDAPDNAIYVMVVNPPEQERVPESTARG